MGWSTEDYRYEQFRNAEKALRENGCSWLMSEWTDVGMEHKNPRYALLVEPVEPRTDFTLLRTMANALREVLDIYEHKATFLYHEEDDAYECMECRSRFRMYIDYAAPTDSAYCPMCGREFVRRDRAEKFRGGGNLE